MSGRGRRGARLVVVAALATAWLAALLFMAGRASPAARAPAVPGQVPPHLSVACPGAACPWSAPTPSEQGIAADVLARIDLERAAPARAYLFGGVRTPLAPLAAATPAARATAQAAAEWEAVHATVTDYGGPDPPGYQFATGDNAVMAGDSAGIDDAIMHSYGHALGVLSAAPTQVAVGAACTSTGTVYVTEDFYDPSEAAAEQGQARLAAELASDSVWAQSGGAVTTVSDAGGTGPAQDYLPQQPIVAGYGPHDAEQYATGADWTCAGVRYPSGTPEPASPLPSPVVATSASPDGGGYALADSMGEVDVHGDASYHGSLPGLGVHVGDIVAMAPSPDGGGYWLVGADGGVFAFGDASYHGSLPGLGVHVGDIVAMAPSPDGGGYWLVGAGGGVFAFGDASYHGSLPGLGVHVGDIVAMAPSPDGGGYWLVGADGGVFAFGDASYHGSLPGLGVHVGDIVAMAPSPDGGGYWLVGADGGVFAFGVPFLGTR